MKKIKKFFGKYLLGKINTLQTLVALRLNRLTDDS